MQDWMAARKQSTSHKRETHIHTPTFHSALGGESESESENEEAGGVCR